MPYPEHDLQNAFVEWFTSTHGYREVATDISTGAAASMDSVGFMGCSPIRIELEQMIGGCMADRSHRMSGIIGLAIQPTAELP